MSLLWVRYVAIKVNLQIKRKARHFEVLSNISIWRKNFFSQYLNFLNLKLISTTGVMYLFIQRRDLQQEVQVFILPLPMAVNMHFQVNTGSGHKRSQKDKVQFGFVLEEGFCLIQQKNLTLSAARVLKIITLEHWYSIRVILYIERKYFRQNLLKLSFLEKSKIVVF